jgi:dihydrofolate synthase / folylpolyglutamate synthase
LDEARLVLEKVSQEKHAPLTLIGRDVRIETGEHSLDGQDLTLFSPHPVRLRIPLLGAHQVVNAATAYAALQASGLKLSAEAIRKGFAEVAWPCRFEVVQRDPPLILDSAHNVDSFQKLAEALDDYFPGKTVVLIFGSSEDKDLSGMLDTLKEKVSLLLVTKADHPRATEPDNIIKLANNLGIPVELAVPVSAALELALEHAAVGDKIVLSAGSMFVTAEVKTAWQKMNNRL